MKNLLTAFLLIILSFYQAAYAISLSDSIILQTEYDKSLRKINQSIFDRDQQTSLDTEFAIKEQFKSSTVLVNVMLTVISPLLSAKDKIYLSEDIWNKEQVKDDGTDIEKIGSRKFDFNLGEFYDDYISGPLTYIIGVPVMFVLLLVISPFAFGAALLDL